MRKKFFNIAGPCHPDRHYMLPAQDRCRGIRGLIDQEQYFVMHAARQSGKTTFLLDLAQELNASGEYYALYCSLDSVQKISNPDEGIPAVIAAIRSTVRYCPNLSGKSFASDQNLDDYTVVLKDSLADFCAELERPLVILFDEADCLSGSTLISFLRQLRTGYVNRYQIPFVHSVGLVGMRNIRDYRARIRRTGRVSAAQVLSTQSEKL